MAEGKMITPPHDAGLEYKEGWHDAIDLALQWMRDDGEELAYSREGRGSLAKDIADDLEKVFPVNR